jgi:NitT/TauT family transport system substrate-binding protein
MTHRTALIALSTLLFTAASGQGTGPEKPNLKLSVGGRGILYYLPLTVAERQGYFKDEGLNIEINDFAGGAKALQALIGGSADITTGSYEHVIQMRAQGKNITGIVNLGRFPGIVLAVNARKASTIKSVKDFKGARIGISAPGSSTNFMVNYLLTKNGLKPEDVSFVTVGTGASAIAAIKRGEIDVISGLDPAITALQADNALKVIADTRTLGGSFNVYGGAYPASTLYVPDDFAKRYPRTTQALANAFVRALRWMDKATPEQIAAVLPEEYFLGDKGLYLQALKNSKSMYSTDGLFTAPGAKNVSAVLGQFDPAIKAANVDLRQTYNNAFVSKALLKYR